ncbi:Uncharacterised protein [Yersinia intermedia]|uniref:hypothetical protein n=1 Tax=Yersinia intermedia TaxID=631 RepID=UPI0005E51B26|nr:hypothetical protein [Yersinia intermedia]CNC78715.1 Uncharacterised protein [Yersinia intermedia]CNH25688.1 Uncharacterised protein [Yersinia intermedia]
MSDGYGFLVKVFSTEKYREDFLDGKLYMNTIKYFKEYEEEKNNNIGDKNEAVTAWLQPKGLRLIIHPPGMDEIIITEKDILGPIIIRTNNHDSYNVLCLTVLHSHEFSINELLTEEQIEQVRGYFKMPEESLNLGAYAVIIPNIPEFISRIKRAAQSLIDSNEANYFSARKLIYYDSNESLSLENTADAVFHKQKEYEHQSEFRLCLDRGKGTEDAYFFNVESLRDIAFPIPTSEINSKIKLETY